MAGSFGFEIAKYDVSMKAAERVLLPAVREAHLDTLVLANGFSCREQIEQGSARKTQHLAEVIAEAIGLDLTAELGSVTPRWTPAARWWAIAGGTFVLGFAAGALLSAQIGAAARLNEIECLSTTREGDPPGSGFLGFNAAV